MAMKPLAGWNMFSSKVSFFNFISGNIDMGRGNRWGIEMSRFC